MIASCRPAVVVGDDGDMMGYCIIELHVAVVTTILEEGNYLSWDVRRFEWQVEAK